MNMIKFILVMSMSTALLGCLSQQAHERAIQDLEMASQQSGQETERLQQVVQEQQAAVV